MGEPHRAAGGSPKPMRTSRRERHRFREFTLATVGLWPTSRCTASTARSGSPSWSGRTTSPPRCRTPCATAGSVTPTCSPGPRGTGKTTTARLLAKALNCTNRGDDGDPCGVCESCVAIAEGSSLDVIEVDAASKSRVEEIRDLLERVAYLSAGGAKKVYILDEVHMLERERRGARCSRRSRSRPSTWCSCWRRPIRSRSRRRSVPERSTTSSRSTRSTSSVGHLADVCAKEGVDADRRGARGHRARRRRLDARLAVAARPGDRPRPRSTSSR